jgi:hypothetical protein
VGEGLGATHFNWRGDVANFVGHIENSFSTWGNTYVNHPTGFGLDDVSVDFWAPFIGWDGVSGRGNPIDPAVGQAVWDYVFFGNFPPFIRWGIWQGWMWDYFDGWIWYCDIDPFDCHFDHVHFTFW